MISDSELEMIVGAGEDDKIERKKLIDLSVKFKQAEFILDMLSLVNAHGDRPAYLLVGVANDGTLHDITAEGYDDARFQQLVNSYVEPPITFNYYERALQGVRVGVFEIPQSRTRFHVVSKDMAEGPKRHLEKGDIRIKRGSSKQRPGAWDFELLRREVARSSEPQPKLDLIFASGGTRTAVPLRPSAHWQTGRWDMRLTPLPVEVNCALQNVGSKEALRIRLDIRPPDDIPIGGGYCPDLESRFDDATRNNEAVSFMGEHLIHGLKTEPIRIELQIPEPGVYQFTWTARAGNMTAECSGSLELTVVSLHDWITPSSRRRLEQEFGEGITDIEITGEEDEE